VRRRGATLLSLAVLTLAGCSLSDDDEPAADAPAKTVTVTETVTVGTPEKPAEKKEKKAKTAPEGERQTAASPKPPPESESGGADATDESSPERVLAIIDQEDATVSRSTVSRYAGLLDRLEGSCNEPRAALAEAALTASHNVETRTKAKLSILQVLREVTASDPSGACADAFVRVQEKHT
jgi:hypothetical protein